MNFKLKKVSKQSLIIILILCFSISWILNHPLSSFSW
jgi:hypothetical protein